ncbi:methionyl-tRNA formyltransferase, mitochondrial-like isoform X1 [Varroa destructor]|uniref:Methionyl-tRNA formyltransferase n=1 Tax=Varroa destructor TaxID=109461 RepID=A0A7M7KQM0_VARDE|nr:methionyl-tRNA formyltransferase, mitochondrial-like isoform X1 [Varroa destructor]XP_022670502.1 methionyl-tRNA formyltransferase, mitochondrial-like isoform X1 [Varroa destructor]
MASWLGRKTLRLLFYGSDHFSLASLRALLSLKLPLAVVTKRRCPVQQVAKDAGLTIHYWPFTVPKGQFDLGVVVSFGQLIPAACIRACTHGMVNVHPSLLPRWRGAAPLVHTILANDERAGVSLITVAQNRFDTGFIINQTLLKESPRDLEYVDLERISARAGITTRCRVVAHLGCRALCKHSAIWRSYQVNVSQHSQISLYQVGASLLVEFMSDVEGLLANARPQSEDGVTKAPKVNPSMGVLDFRQTITQVDCRRRAVADFEPLTCWYGRWKLRLFLLPLSQRPPDPSINDILREANSAAENAYTSDTLINGIVPPGYAFYHKKRRLLTVRCIDGWVWAEHVTVKGRRKMTAQEFYAGFLNKSDCKTFTREPLTAVHTSSQKLPHKM